MRNSESRKGKLFALITLALFVSVVLGAIRIEFAREALHSNYVSDFAETYGVITDRYGITLYDGEVKEPTLFGNLLDNSGMTEKTIPAHFSDELQPGEVSRWSGYRSLEEEPRVLKTTLLSADSLRAVAEAFQGADGCVFSFNYETGEVYTALSFPYLGSGEEGSFLNRCMDDFFVPGSTMKVVTSVVALEQGIHLENLTYHCDGAYELYDGSTINCHGIHGDLRYVDALGKSCNCFFAQLIMQLNLDKTIESLGAVGFSVNGAAVEGYQVSRLDKKQSSAQITNTASFQNLWGLIGQGDSLANPVDMARIIGAIANDGESVMPYMVESVVNPNRENELVYKNKSPEPVRIMSKETARKMQDYLGLSTDTYYRARGVNEKVTYAKTGTAQVTGGKENSLFLGVSEESKTAFMIVVTDWRSREITALSIANYLVEILPNQ